MNRTGNSDALAVRFPDGSSRERSAGSFRGSSPRGGSPVVVAAAAEPVRKRWSTVSRYDRLARAIDAAALTPTGTVRVAFEVSTTSRSGSSLGSSSGSSTR